MITVLGAGAIGAAIAIHLARNGKPVRLWGTGYDSELLNEMKESHFSSALQLEMPVGIEYYHEDRLKEALRENTYIIYAVSSRGLIPVTEMIAPHLSGQEVILSITKGFCVDHGLELLNAVRVHLPEKIRDNVRYVKIGGPIKAHEFAAGFYTRGVFACSDMDTAARCGDLFRSSAFKGETTDDVSGVGVCSALKNSFAIWVGIAEGYQPEVYNTHGVIVSQAVTEMSRLTDMCGGKRETAFGLAGIGDLYLTVQSGRNVTFGKLIGKYGDVARAKEDMRNVTVEGIDTCEEFSKYLEKLEKENRFRPSRDVPLFNELHEILFRKKHVEAALAHLWSGP
jgi:glycerol-3-phosphate dehydrogenase (NAD(P)+)